MTSLVLGGSVFVGKRLVRALLDDGQDVAVLNRGRTATELPAGVERLVADRTDASQLRTVLDGRDWDAVFDVSGFVMAAGGGDIAGLVELLDGHTGRYVFVSSVMAYDQRLVGRFPWTEDLPSNADGPASYGGFKAMSERAMLARHATTGFPVTVVRPAAIYGPDNNIYDMEAAMFLRLLQRRPVLVPHCGLVVGSYGHVDDLCAAMLALARHPAAVGEIVNVSTDSVDVNTYVRTLADVVGVEPDVVPVPDSALASITVPVFGHLFGVRHHAMVDLSKLAGFGVSACYGIRDGHRHTYEWFRESGLHEVTSPLADPVWRVTWDFDAEAAFADRVRATARVAGDA